MLRHHSPSAPRLLDAIVVAVTAAVVSADALSLPILVVMYLLVRWPRRTSGRFGL